MTISLAYSMQKMIKDKNFVRHLAASETMGEVTTICSDKTGTLTENRMTVVKSCICGVEEVTQSLSAEMRSLFHEAVSVNSTVLIENIDSKTPNFIGNKTEGALLVFSRRELGVQEDLMVVRTRLPKLAEIPFSSARKRMSTAVRTSNNRIALHCKGAAEIVIDHIR